MMDNWVKEEKKGRNTERREEEETNTYMEPILSGVHSRTLGGI